MIAKIKGLCERNKIPMSKLESDLGFGNGSLTKNNPGAIKNSRVREIADYFGVTPTYLMTDMKFCLCPTCSIAFDPLDEDGYSMETHKRLHNNYLKLREKMGYLLNPTEAATKRAVAMASLEDSNIPEEGKIFHYETLIQCDFAEYAYFNNFIVDISYSDFIKEQIRERKYFEVLPPSVIKNLTVKYNVDLNDDDKPLTELFQSDKEFMANITDLWDLPQQLRYDVYKAIRHAKRDYADKEYYTNPYANIVTTCYDYDENNKKCQNCEKGKHE